MKSGIWAIAILGILILGTLGLAQNVFAPQGQISWINPPAKLGKIAEDGCNDKSCEYPFKIPADLSDPDYEPHVGDLVSFDIGPGNTATNVEKMPEPPFPP